MNEAPTTRERLLAAAHLLFSRSGYAATPVREICNVARANPGAVSYHFGGKRQLYRAVLRRAAVNLGAAVRSVEASSDSTTRTVEALVDACLRDPTPFRLLLRDLADGGEGAVESFAPVIRSGFEHLLAASEAELDPEARRGIVRGLLRTTAPAFLLLAAWPVLARAFDLPGDALEAWVLRLTPDGE